MIDTPSRHELIAIQIPNPFLQFKRNLVITNKNMVQGSCQHLSQKSKRKRVKLASTCRRSHAKIENG